MAVISGGWRVWVERRRWRGGRGLLPDWPTSPADPSPALVIGEVHHPTKAQEITRPEWLTIPERGLYTGIAIFGAVGSGKTSACMHPFATQLFGWQAGDPQKRPAGLVLEVKGDFCYDVRAILDAAGRQRRLHRAWPRRFLAMEPAALNARLVQPGLHRRQLAQSTVRQGAKSRSGSRPTPTSCAGSLSCTGACPDAGAPFETCITWPSTRRPSPTGSPEARRVAGGDQAARPERIVVAAEQWHQLVLDKDREALVNEYAWTAGDGGRVDLALHRGDGRRTDGRRRRRSTRHAAPRSERATWLVSTP